MKNLCVYKSPYKKGIRDFFAGLILTLAASVVIRLFAGGCGERGTGPNEVLTLSEDLEQIVRLSDREYSEIITVKGILTGGVGLGSGMVHLEMKTGQKNLKRLGHNIKFLVRIPSGAYAELCKEHGSNWAGRCITVMGTLDKPAGWNYAIIVQIPQEVLKIE